MWRVRVLLILLVILIIIVASLSICVGAKDIISITNEKNKIVVDKNGNGDFLSIQDAIDFAHEGNIVFVNSGVYNEIIEIKKEISIIGEDKVNTIINPISEKNKYAIFIGSPYVKIIGFSITNEASGFYTSGIQIASSKVEIINCNIYDVPVGIAIWSSNNIINNCHFWGCSDEGIALVGSIFSECFRNEISNCKFFDNCDGIELQYSSYNLIKNCEIYENTHIGIDAIISSNNFNRILNCKIYDNKVYGIFFVSSLNNQIIDCIINENRFGNVVFRKNLSDNKIEIKDSIEFSSKDKENFFVSFYEILPIFDIFISNIFINL